MLATQWAGAADTGNSAPPLIGYKAPPAGVTRFLNVILDILGAIIAVPIVLLGLLTIAMDHNVRAGVLYLCSAFLFAPKLNALLVDRTWGVKMSPPLRIVVAVVLSVFTLAIEGDW